VSVLGLFHLYWFGAAMPYLAIKSKSRIQARPLPPRRRLFMNSAATLVALGALSLVAARAEHITLFPVAPPRATGVGAGAVMLALFVTFMRPRWRQAVEQRKRVLYMFMPRDRVERALWLVVSLAAGVSEEITWRGVQPALVARLIGRPVAAAAIVAVTFGISHMTQGRRSVAIISISAMAFQGLVWLSGSLYVAMAVHFLYDATAGLTYGKLGEELGYPIEGIMPPDVPMPA